MLPKLLIVLLVLVSNVHLCFTFTFSHSLFAKRTFESKRELETFNTRNRCYAKNKWSPEEETEDANLDGISYTVELPKSAGIEWAADLSFRWIYVLGLVPSGPASQSGMIQKGDFIIGFGNVSTIGQDFDFVLQTLGQQEPMLNYTFFRGSKEQLMGGPIADPTSTTYSIKVVQDGKPDKIIQCNGGSNLRNALVSNGINVYRSLTRWTNCNGKQLCGTCIVDVEEGGENCSRRALNEESILQENPATYRLCCRTSVYGDLTVKVQGPVGVSQWTR